MAIDSHSSFYSGFRSSTSENACKSSEKGSESSERPCSSSERGSLFFRKGIENSELPKPIDDAQHCIAKMPATEQIFSAFVIQFNFSTAP